MKLFKHLSCLFVLNPFCPIIFAFFKCWKNTWPRWWIGPIVGGVFVTLNRSRWWMYVCESMIYGTRGSARLSVWVSACEKNNSLLKWPWEELEEVLEHKITVETVSDELCVYVSICGSVLCRARSYAGWHCALIVVITHDAIVGKRNSCLGN